MAESRLSRPDYEEYLLRLYFGYGSDYLRLCIDRAYRDFARTMRGFAKFDAKENAHKQARNCVHQQLSHLPKLGVTTNGEFDDWHRQVCEALASVYRENGFAPFYIGQAQKWLNMALKYIYTMGVQRIAGYDAIYSFCHVPLDNILIGQLEKYDFPALSTRWSRIETYESYLSSQNWIRKRFSVAPLDVEFLLWMGKSPD